uniref:Pept_C1 domain-containing protein n=1 Tax=Enterobius vermicularis TaxID=51028 RepID=A0A0N4UYS5_ENTVE
LEQYRNRVIDPYAESLEGQELVDYINQNQNLWRAKLNTKFDDYSDRVKYGLLGVDHVKLSVSARKNLSPTRFYNIYIPENFDARERWPYCGSLKNIRDQSSCGSCWAFGAVEAMSDRICIASKGRIQVSLSAADLLSCCKSCGFGCDGGDPMAAWKYWVKEGIVTGSNFSMNQGCKPYPFPPCEHHSNKTHYKPCQHDLFPTPKCSKQCIDGYNRSYASDKFYGSTAYGIADDVEAIQKEILTNGPVEVAFEVYDDFLHYDGGIYTHTGGKIGGGHAVKMLGWGIEQGVPYWIVANSWNTDWGENGFFRIIRGVDECGIESGVVAGKPKINYTYNKLDWHQKSYNTANDPF